VTQVVRGDRPLTNEFIKQTLRSVDPSRALVIVPCSARKRLGGRPGEVAQTGGGLVAARQRVFADTSTHADETKLMPAYERYDGHLYRSAKPTIAELATQGRLLILSGGYGVLDGRDLIGTYDRMMRSRDWPDGLLEQSLAARTREFGRDVVAFVSTTTDYAKVLRGTPWQLAAGRSAHLVTVQGLRGATAVSIALGHALLAFATGANDYPAETVVETLAP
jgi:hypothetical protein